MAASHAIIYSSLRTRRAFLSDILYPSKEILKNNPCECQIDVIKQKDEFRRSDWFLAVVKWASITAAPDITPRLSNINKRLD